MVDARRQRLAPAARMDLLLDAAETTFAARGFAASGLAEIAEIAGVSKTLLYHYFPDGRPELYRAVVDRFRADLLPTLDEAAAAPLSPSRRIDLYVDALLAFFGGHPRAGRLVLLEPWGSGDPTVVAQAVALRTRLTADVAGILAGSAPSIERITAAATALLGAVLQVCEQIATGALDTDAAKDVTRAFVVGGLREVGLL